MNPPNDLAAVRAVRELTLVPAVRELVEEWKARRLVPQVVESNRDPRISRAAGHILRTFVVLVRPETVYTVCGDVGKNWRAYRAEGEVNKGKGE